MLQPRDSLDDGDEPSAQRALVALFDEGDVEGIKQMSVQYDIEVLPHPVQNQLQELLDCARAACHSIDASVESQSAGDGVWLHINPAENKRLGVHELQKRAREWIIRAAFRDAMEAAHIALESARLVLAVRSLPGTVKGEDFNRVVLEDGEKFHQWPLKRKLEHLDRKYGFALDPTWIDVVMGLNAVRNCVVHRFGEVGSPDVRDGGSLSAVWQVFRVMAGREGELRQVYPGDVVQGGETVRIQRGPTTRKFLEGEHVDLSMQDLNEICNTIHLFACHVREALRPHLPGPS